MTRVSPQYTREALAKYGVVVGEHTYGIPVIRWWGEAAGLQIGNYCSIADGVQIFMGGNHRTDFLTSYPFSSLIGWPDVAGVGSLPETKGNVVIGNDVWVGSGVSILSGVTIGDGAVIGARTVVSRDVEPYSVVVGNPGRVIRKRFPNDVIEDLLKIRWWEWRRERIEEYMPLILSKDIRRFVTAAYGAEGESAAGLEPATNNLEGCHCDTDLRPRR
jgi:acetyltransferase-like isoleucine patch superfamily enzyme